MSQDIEDILRRLPLRKPPDTLDGRAIPARGIPVRLAWAGVAAAVAAAVVIAVLVHQAGQRNAADLGRPRQVASAGSSATSVEAAADPVRLERTWSRTDYEGLILLDDTVPMRKFRWHELQQIQWTDPARGIQYEVTVPREKIILVKATTN
jgi:hypothetical protein